MIFVALYLQYGDCRSRRRRCFRSRACRARAGRVRRGDYGRTADQLSERR